MIDLSLDEVLFIHDDFIRTYGGSLGVRDRGLLESAFFRPQATFGGHELYPTLFKKAAALFHGILFNHPFVDGNKRTALGCVVYLLRKNGWQFTATIEESVAFPLAVEKGRPNIEEIAQWIKEHEKKMKKVQLH